MKKIAFFSIIFLVILSLYVFVSRQNSDDEDMKIDVTDTGFEYDVAVCDKYFELVGCIIDRDTNENYTKEMRIELKNIIKDLQEEWKQLTEEELSEMCTESLKELEESLEKEGVNSFGCYTKSS